MTAAMPTTLRKSNLFFGFLACCFLILLLLSVHAHFKVQADAPSLQRTISLVKKLGLTDLCLFTEARYTRNPSQADHHAPFQDHPMALEHFPAGSLMEPPLEVRYSIKE